MEVIVVKSTREARRNVPSDGHGTTKRVVYFAFLKILLVQIFS